MHKQVAAVMARFGCTEEAARAQYLANSQQLAGMAAKAKRIGKKVGGFTADQLTERAQVFASIACAE